MIKVRILVPLVLLGVLVSPLRANAGLADFIWEMSGPNLFGFGLECHLDGTSFDVKKCPAWPAASEVYPSTKTIWLTIDARYYFSSTKDSGDEEDKQYTAASVHMFGVDPMLVYGNIHSNNTWRLSTGVGFSFNRLWGSKVEDAFNNYAFKFKLLEADRRIGSVRVGAGYTLRLYPDGFETSGGLHRKEEAEWVQGGIISFYF